ncbi:hypothetical protein JIY74_35585, partial [Vibrio harveyi]|nr:hypothetical protein [Vibrio harveyi]
FLTFIANIKIYLTIWCENKQTFTQIEKVNPMKKQINIQEELFNEINNSFKNKKIIKTANKLTNNYLNQAKGTDFLVKAIAIPRACTIESSKKTGIWITNIKNNARIFIPNNFVYDEDKSKTTILIALPLFTNKKKFNCYLRKKGAQRSSNIGTIKAFIFLLKINVFYHIEKGKQKFNEKKEQTKQAVEQA